MIDMFRSNHVNLVSSVHWMKIDVQDVLKTAYSPSYSFSTSGIGDNWSSLIPCMFSIDLACNTVSQNASSSSLSKEIRIDPGKNIFSSEVLTSGYFCSTCFRDSDTFSGRIVSRCLIWNPRAADQRRTAAAIRFCMLPRRLNPSRSKVPEVSFGELCSAGVKSSET